MLTLRPYQKEAFSTLLQALRQDRFVLLQAATGAGKTILFSALIQHCVERYGMRVGILAHREVLVRQAYEKLLAVWPQSEKNIGFACRSVSSKVDLQKSVFIASPQTLISHLSDMPMPPVHLLIIDECHRVPPRNEQSQYRTLIESLERYDPTLHVLGVTATPYRLGHGMIYGDACRTKAQNWWKDLHSSISISTIQKQGFLVPFRAKEAESIEDDLVHVRKDKGEFNTKDLAGVMEKSEHVGSAVKACRHYGEGRKHVVVFAVTISHAEKLTTAFQQAGYAAGCVHSQMPQERRHAVLKDFEEGRLQVICNVGVLTEGWDCTAVDCMLLCRPTLSPALYVQMIGRGLRLHPGKEDCLVLDLSGNCIRHGNPDDPILSIPANKDEKKGNQGKQEAPMRPCPECQELLIISTSSCPQCGYTFPQPVMKELDTPVNMKDILWSPTQFEVNVLSCTPSAHKSRVGNTMLRLALVCRHTTGTIRINQYLDIEGQGSAYGKIKAREVWIALSGQTPPKTVEQAMKRANELNISEKITVKKDNHYFKVLKW